MEKVRKLVLTNQFHFQIFSPNLNPYPPFLILICLFIERGRKRQATEASNISHYEHSNIKFIN